MEKTSLVGAVVAFGLVGAPQTGATQDMTQTTAESIITELRAETRGDVVLMVQRAREARDGASDDVRADLAAAIGLDGANHTDPAARRAAAAYLAEEVETGIPVVSRVAAIGAQRLQAASFSLSDRTRLATALKHAPSDVEVIRAAAVAEADVAEALKAIAASGFEGVEGGRLRTNAAWTATIALARLHNNEALEAVLRRARTEKDDVALGSVIFPDLAFTAQPAALDWLYGQLSNNRRLPKLKPAQKMGALLAWYSARAILSVVRDAPNIVNLSEEEAVADIIRWRNSVQGWPIIR